MTFSRRIVRIVLLAFLFSLLPMFTSGAVANDWSPPTTVWVEATGHTVDGYFLDEWRNALELFGNPISEELTRPVKLESFPADQRIVQYFDNLAIVYVPESDSKEQRVQALPLGEDALMRDRLFLSHPNASKPIGCRDLLPTECVEHENGFAINAEFLDFWQENGADHLIGWPLTESLAIKSGELVQYFENAVLTMNSTGKVEPRDIGRESTKALNIHTERIEKPVSVPAYDENLFVPPEPQIVPVEGGNQPIAGGPSGEIIENPKPQSAQFAGPGPQQGAFKEIVVSISAQTLWAYENSTLMAETLVSTGTGEVLETVTPLGYYTILVKYDVQTMEGTISNEYYKVDDVPWVMYFDNLGNAIHGTYWHNNFGTPMSHGCVNVPLDVAEFLYYWAPVGAAVTVIA